MTAFWALVARELRLSLRHGADTLAALLFFALTATLFPLAIGPEPETSANPERSAPEKTRNAQHFLGQTLSG